VILCAQAGLIGRGQAILRPNVFVEREGDDLRMVRGVVVAEDPLFPLSIFMLPRARSA